METSKAEEYLQSNKIQDEYYEGERFPFVVSEETARHYASLVVAETLEKVGGELPKDPLTFHPDAVSQGMTVMKRNPNGEYVKYEAYCDYRDNVTALLAKYKAEVAEAKEMLRVVSSESQQRYEKQHLRTTQLQQENERLKIDDSEMIEAGEFAEWILVNTYLVRGSYTSGEYKWWSDRDNKSYTTTELLTLTFSCHFKFFAI